MLLGHWIEMRSIGQAQGALKELAKLLPATAVRVAGDREEEVPLSALRAGDLVLVRPGARVPADGVVSAGESAVDESMITGESRPVTKRAGDHLVAGTVNGAGSLRAEVTGIGEQTALAGIMRLVSAAQTSRSRAQALADRAAFLLTVAAVAAAVVTAVVWVALGAPGGVRGSSGSSRCGAGRRARPPSERAGPGQATVFLLDAGRVLAGFAVADAVRPESRAAVDRLHSMGVGVAMLTGDARWPLAGSCCRPPSARC